MHDFANSIRERRMELGYTLRQFALNKGYDVAYISRLENRLMPAPSDPEKLNALATALELTPESVAWVEFFDLASLSRHETPEDLKNNPVVPRFLPAFYRTLRKDKISDEEVQQLANLIRGSVDERSETEGSSAKSTVHRS